MKIKVLRKVYVSCLMLFKEEPLRLLLSLRTLSAHLSVNGMTWLLVMLEADVRHVVLRCLLGVEFVWPLCPPFTLLSLVTGVRVAGLVWGTSPGYSLCKELFKAAGLPWSQNGTLTSFALLNRGAELIVSEHKHSLTVSVFESGKESKLVS